MSEDFGGLVSSFKARKGITVAYMVMAAVIGAVCIFVPISGLAIGMEFSTTMLFPLGVAAICALVVLYNNLRLKRTKIEFYERGFKNYNVLSNDSVAYSSITNVKGTRSNGGTEFDVTYEDGSTIINESFLEKGARAELERVTGVHFK